MISLLISQEFATQEQTKNFSKMASAPTEYLYCQNAKIKSDGQLYYSQLRSNWKIPTGSQTSNV